MNKKRRTILGLLKLGKNTRIDAISSMLRPPTAGKRKTMDLCSLSFNLDRSICLNLYPFNNTWANFTRTRVSSLSLFLTEPSYEMAFSLCHYQSFFQIQSQFKYKSSEFHIGYYGEVLVKID